MIPLCLDQGVGVIPWSPLARGVLAGNRTREGEKRTTRVRDRPVHRLPLRPSRPTSTSSSASPRSPRERGVPPAQVALAWLLHQPGVTAPIVGATKLEPPATTRSPPSSSTLDRRRDRAARGALPAPPRPRPLTGTSRSRATWASPTRTTLRGSPGCYVTRRDILRWTAVAAGRGAGRRAPWCAPGRAWAGRRRHPAQPRAGDAHRGPGDHHLVHGLHRHRRRPRPDGAGARRRRGAWGTDPDRLDRVAGERPAPTRRTTGSS